MRRYFGLLKFLWIAVTYTGIREGSLLRLALGHEISKSCGKCLLEELKGETGCK